jgi:hypothetical protein
MDAAFGALAAAIVVTILAVLVLSQLSWDGAERLAHERAEVMLRTHLSDSELAQLQRSGVLDVPSPTRPGRLYQVPGNGGRIKVLQDGHPVLELCIHPRSALPGKEHVLAHKLMIEAAEEEYTRRANVMWRAGQATVFGRTTRLD